MEQGTCPVCTGTKRRAVPAECEAYKDIMSGYDKITDTLACDNCGGQVMYGTPTGIVNLREDGTTCIHEYTKTKIGNCYHRFTCKHCSFIFSIDSGD